VSFKYKHVDVLLKCIAAAFLTLSVALIVACSDDSTTTPSVEPGVTLTDIDGNSYKVVKIGNQWWMAENLKVTHYRNGDAIPNITNNAAWSGLPSGAYGDYNNDPANGSEYGRLYNWYAVADTNGLAPKGWHVASDTEWQILVDYLGGDTVAGGKMKETGIVHWFDPNDASNTSGFSALPAGTRYGGNGNYFNLGEIAFFWSSTEYDADLAWNRSLVNSDPTIERYYNNGKQNGFSVRCVKD
jgi:uncharacterized protein (TIGR02145 family)